MFCYSELQNGRSIQLKRVFSQFLLLPDLEHGEDKNGLLLKLPTKKLGTFDPPIP